MDCHDFFFPFGPWAISTGSSAADNNSLQAGFKTAAPMPCDVGDTREVFRDINSARPCILTNQKSKRMGCYFRQLNQLPLLQAPTVRIRAPFRTQNAQCPLFACSGSGHWIPEIRLGECQEGVNLEKELLPPEIK